MKDLEEIYLVEYKENYSGGFYETYKEFFTIPLRAIEFIEILQKDENISDIKFRVFYEQNIDYLKDG